MWSEIADLAADFGGGSSTGALNEIAGGRSDDLKAWLAAFPAVPGQNGILAFLGSDPPRERHGR